MIFLELMIKGFFIGIAFIIPGLSGGTLAVYLGVYEKLLHSISNVFKEFKKSIEFLLPLFLGIAISIVLLAKLFSILIEWNSFIVLLFFIGLIIGGIKPVFNKVKGQRIDIYSIFAFFASFTIIILLIIGKTRSTNSIDVIRLDFLNIVLVFIIGMLASMTMIVPGISGSALLLVLGYYTAIVSNVVGNLFDFSSFLYNVEVLIPFGLGALLGIILFSRVIELCFKKFNKQTYYAILGFILASIIAIFYEIRDPSTAVNFENQLPIYQNIFEYISNNLFSVLGGLVSLVLGFIASSFLSKIELTKSKAK